MESSPKWQIYSRLIVPIKVQGKSSLIVGIESAGHLEWTELSILFSVSQSYALIDEDAREQLVSYFEKQLILFSNLCYGRNYSNKNFLGVIFSDDILSKYVWNTDLEPRIRAALLRIMLYIHVDSKPRTINSFPMLTKTYQGTSEQQQQQNGSDPISQGFQNRPFSYKQIDVKRIF